MMAVLRGRVVITAPSLEGKEVILNIRVRRSDVMPSVAASTGKRSCSLAVISADSARSNGESIAVFFTGPLAGVVTVFE
jgi:hypothetical protein